MKKHISNYLSKLSSMLEADTFSQILPLGEALLDSWEHNKNIFICGNGGSAGNAIHLANDLIYGAGIKNGFGLRVESLSANSAVITCLANDIGYDNIFSEQIRVKASCGDLLIALSGSGNSANIVKAIETGNSIGMKTFAILGYSGGKCKKIVHHPIHFEVNDMQVAEDLQLIVGHICMQWLSEKNIKVKE
jgi:D-sedoheptulose 7-phosphate isomerase